MRQHTDPFHRALWHKWCTTPHTMNRTKDTTPFRWIIKQAHPSHTYMHAAVMHPRQELYVSPAHPSQRTKI